MAGPKSTDFLSAVVKRRQQRFVEEKTLLSFGEYLGVAASNAPAQARDSAAFLRDAFDFYGTETVRRPTGTVTRYRLFDVPFDGGKDALVGHERVQNIVYGLLTDFARQGRVSRLILLHGPNGSAKSSFISCLMRALEDYSHQPEGALYTFNWVFPSARAERGAIGFSGGRDLDSHESFAHLPEGSVDARLRTETRDHPLLLLPRAERVAFLREHLGPDVRIPRSLTEAELSPKARQIYDALLRAYQGDLGEVLKHVQVERFYISRRYRQAAVTVDPQMRADANVRQVTADRSLGSLPPSLHNLTLYEPMGDLVEANRGIIEYNDLLKRPVEAFKYLLSTCEQGAVRLDTMNLYLDTVFIGSCNAGHLSAFKEMPDFASFKARIELVEVPYLVDYQLERRIYAEQVDPVSVGRPVAPHTDEVAALWAVLTRLERPRTDIHPASLRKILAHLEPLDKAELYARAQLPKGLDRDVANTLANHIDELYAEPRGDGYEGRFGASPREIRTALMVAARSSEHGCLTPVSVLEALRELTQQRSTYEFLRLKPDGDYHRPEKSLEVVEAWYVRQAEDELHRALGLVNDDATRELFDRYIDHTVHYARREKRLNPHSGAYEDADERLMSDVEGRLGITGDKASFRGSVMHRIGAWRMENPDGALDYARIFAEELEKISDAFYQEKRALADDAKRELLTYLVDGADRLEPDAQLRVEATLERLAAIGYEREAAVEVISFILKRTDGA